MSMKKEDMFLSNYVGNIEYTAMKLADIYRITKNNDKLKVITDAVEEASYELEQVASILNNVENNQAYADYLNSLTKKEEKK